MSRTALTALSVAILLVSSRMSFALDSSVGVGGKGFTASISAGTNRTADYQSVTPGFSTTTIVGRGVPIVTKTGTNLVSPHASTGSIILPNAAKGFTSDSAVVGRNDPPPNIGGRHLQQTIAGGLGM